MGEKQAAPVMVMVVAVLVLAAATPTAYGQLGSIGNLVGNVVSFSGRVCCSPTENCNSTTPRLQGAQINIICMNRLLNTSVTVGNGTTSASGIFNVTVTNLLNQVGSTATNVLNGGLPLSCVTAIALLINGAACPVLNNVNSVLVGVTQFLTSILGTVLGTVTNVVVTFFISIMIT